MEQPLDFLAGDVLMKELSVDSATISATTKCSKQFSCLAGDGEICAVEYSMNKGISFVNCAEDSGCCYRTSYGDGWICLCPVRNEIYNKYAM